MELQYKHMKASTNQVSYHQLMTVTIIYWQLRSTGWVSDLQLRSTGSDSYDQLPENFEVQVFAPSWTKTHGHSWNTQCDMTPTCQCHMGTAHGQVFLISSIVWSHRFRPSPSWLMVTAVGRNCYSPVKRGHRKKNVHFIIDSPIKLALPAIISYFKAFLLSAAFMHHRTGP